MNYKNCFCGENNFKLVIRCSICFNSYHLRCLGLTAKRLTNVYQCPKCQIDDTFVFRKLTASEYEFIKNVFYDLKVCNFNLPINNISNIYF